MTGALAMSRGRPRRINVRRKPSGDVVESQANRTEDPRTLPAWHRSRNFAARHWQELGLDPRMGSSAGQTLILRQISVPQFEAAMRWAGMLDNYDRLIMGKRPAEKPLAYERVSPGEGGEPAAERVAAFRASFDEAHRELMGCGMLVEAAVNAFCRDQTRGAARLPDILRGLSALAVHWGLTGSSKRATRGK